MLAIWPRGPTVCGVRSTVKVAAAQVREVLGDVPKALAVIETYARRAEAAGVRLLCFPECFLQGYLHEPEAARRIAAELESAPFCLLLRQLAKVKPMVVFGLIEREGDRLYNAAAVVHRGELIGKYRKRHLLGTEGIYQPGADYPVFDVDGLIFGINICYDTQFPEAAAAVRDKGARLIVCPANNMLPRMAAEDWKDRHNVIRAARTRETGLWLISSDVTGERDGMIGLGPTCALDPQGRVVASVPLRKEGLVTVVIP